MAAGKSTRAPTRFRVAIPTFNRRDLVLLSLKSALAQTRQPELVQVICDGCTDGTQEAVAALDDPRVQILDVPKGPGYGYGHRNDVLERAGDDVVMWLGDDDVYLPDHLDLVGRRFDAGDVDIVQSRACLVHPDDRLQRMSRSWDEPRYRQQLLDVERNATPMSAVAVRAPLVRKVGGWDVEQPRWGDWELWRRLLRAGARHAMLLQPTVLHFQATGRTQDYADRIRQNTEFAEMIADPVGCERLRSRMAADWAADESWLEESNDERAEWIETLEARGRAMIEQIAEMHAAIVELAGPPPDEDADGKSP